MLKFGSGFILGFIAGFAALFVLILIFGDYSDTPTSSTQQTFANTQAIVDTTAAIDSSSSVISDPSVPTAQIVGLTYDEICNVNERDMTDPQIAAHAQQYRGRSIDGWRGWVYDVTAYGDTYDLQLAMRERGLLWSRDVVIENIDPALATSLNVEQQVVLSGRIERIDTTLEVMCNPMYVTDAIITFADGTQRIASRPDNAIAVATAAELPTSSPTIAPAPTWTPVPPGMNTDLIIDNIRWRAIGLEEIGNQLAAISDYDSDATTSGKFVRVFLEVENRRNEPTRDYEPPDLVDGQSRRFAPYNDRFGYIPLDKSCYAETFNPNLTRQCIEIYEVAADSGALYKIIVNNFESFDPIEAIIEMRQ